MSTAELLEQLRHLNHTDRLLVIETATRLMREELSAQKTESRQERNERLRAAALEAREWYRPGSELTEWTVLDAEDFIDDYGPG